MAGRSVAGLEPPALLFWLPQLDSEALPMVIFLNLFISINQMRKRRLDKVFGVVEAKSDPGTQQKMLRCVAAGLSDRIPK